MFNYQVTIQTVEQEQDERQKAEQERDAALAEVINPNVK